MTIKLNQFETKTIVGKTYLSLKKEVCKYYNIDSVIITVNENFCNVIITINSTDYDLNFIDISAAIKGINACLKSIKNK